MHVYCRLIGHGHAVVPYPPFRATRYGQDVAIEAQGKALVLTAGGGSVVASPPDAVGVVADVEVESASGDWRLQTSLYSCAWPSPYVLHSTPDFPGFDLVGPNGELVFVQGPLKADRVPELEHAVSPGQRLIGTGTLAWSCRWIDVACEHDGTHWRQRLLQVPYGDDAFVLVTGQATEEFAGAAAEAANLSATTLAAPATQT